MDMSKMDMYRETAQWLSSRFTGGLSNPKIAVICGTGLGGLADMVAEEPRITFNYGDIPHFPLPSVEGHIGKLVVGYLAKVPVLLMVGRLHFYEGNSMEQTTYPLRVFKLLGVETIVATNAAGGLNPEYNVGDVVVVSDHVFLAGLGGLHPLRGPNLDEIGPRFPPLSDAYDLELRRAAHAAWKNQSMKAGKRRLHEGVYAFVAGPTYETRAECRFLRMLGADLVGMSTVPEVIVARHSGMRMLVLSLVTNKAILEPGPRGDDPMLHGAADDHLKSILGKGKANHEEVVEAGQEAAVSIQNLVAHFIKDVFQSPD